MYNIGDVVMCCPHSEKKKLKAVITDINCYNDRYGLYFIDTKQRQAWFIESKLKLKHRCKGYK